MTKLNIHHTTAYRFSSPVTLRAHRLMLRPRESRELKLISSRISLAPEATVTWALDVFGNAVATATFGAMTDQLVIESHSELVLDTAAWPVFNIAVSAMSYPFRYSDDEWADLGTLATPPADEKNRLKSWAQSFVSGGSADTLSLLKDMSAGIADAIQYQRRETEGTQTALQTIDRGWGSCRDFAVLFVDAVRSLGFGARIVSGYLHNPDQLLEGSSGTGSTHAWAEVYVPGAGWINFDPTNRSVGGLNLIPVAVVRDIRQAVPVSGSFIGPANAFAEMTVEVRVSA